MNHLENGEEILCGFDGCCKMEVLSPIFLGKENPGIGMPGLRGSSMEKNSLRSDGDAACFAGANAIAFVQGQHEDLAVTDAVAVGMGGLEDRVDGGLDVVFVDGDF